MAGKKGSDATAKPTRKRTVRSAHSRMEFLGKTGRTRAKSSLSAKASTKHLPEGPVRVRLTDADVVRIDEICAKPPAVTDHMRTAIEAYRKLIRA